MEIEIGMDKESREGVVKVLKTLLAATYAFYIKTQNYHWNLVGAQFYSLHVLFQKQYEELAETIDEMAERIRALGFPVLGGLREFQKNSFIEDELDPTLDIKNILHSQVSDHGSIIGYIREHLAYVETVRDGASADFLNKRLAAHEKMAWMLRSSL